MYQVRPLIILRITVALLIGTHGIARIYLGIVDDFGLFFEAIGVPFGEVLAWVVTIFELVGSVLLIVNRYVFWISTGFAIQLAMGISLVHFKEGWFVVGAGRNGMEYSVLLIAVFIAIALDSGRNN